MGFSNVGKAQRVRELSQVTRNCPMISEHDRKSDCRLTAPRPVVASPLTGGAAVASPLTAALPEAIPVPIAEEEAEAAEALPVVEPLPV